MMENLAIFDMDGVISDTQKYHAEAEIQILKSYGIAKISPTDTTPISQEYINNNFAGVQPKVWMHNFFVQYNKEHLFDIETIEDKKNQLLLDMYQKRSIQPIPGAIDFIKHAKHEGYRLAVITASTRACMLRVLEQLALADQFDVLTSLYDCDPITGRPFPAKSQPDVFYHVLDRLGVARGTSFPMIEDGNSGIQGAIQAGGYGVAYLGEMRSPSDFPQAKLWIRDFTKMNIQDIFLSK